MLHAIGTAQRSVALSSYIFRNDQTGVPSRRPCGCESTGRRGAGADRRHRWRLLYCNPIYRHLRAAGVPAGLFHALGSTLAHAVFEPADPHEAPHHRRRDRFHRRDQHRGRKSSRSASAKTLSADTHFSGRRPSRRAACRSVVRSWRLPRARTFRAIAGSRGLHRRAR